MLESKFSYSYGNITFLPLQLHGNSRSYNIPNNNQCPRINFKLCIKYGNKTFSHLDFWESIFNGLISLLVYYVSL